MADFVPVHQGKGGVAVLADTERDRGADDATDDGVRGGNRQPFIRGKKQPQGGGNQRAHHHEDELHRLNINHRQIDDALADGVRHLFARNQRAADLKHGRDDERLGDGKRASADGSTKRIGDVIAADVKGHEQAKSAGEEEDEAVIEAGVTQPPIDEISYRGDKHGNQKLAHTGFAAYRGRIRCCRFLHKKIQNCGRFARHNDKS